MTCKKRTEIKVETSEVLVLQSRKRFTRVRCPQCNNLVSMLTIAEAATASGSSERKICRQVEEGAVHFTETGRGRLLICSGSLMDESAGGQIMQIE